MTKYISNTPCDLKKGVLVFKRLLLTEWLNGTTEVDKDIQINSLVHFVTSPLFYFSVLSLFGRFLCVSVQNYPIVQFKSLFSLKY